MIIDAHHHLWTYSPREYGWIDDCMTVIARDFSVYDMIATASQTGVGGSIVVQARQTMEETSWLLDVADRSNFIQGVVGWVPLASDDLEQVLDRFHGRGKLKGVRHVIHDELDDQFILGERFNRGVAQTTKLGLVYDILIFERHLPQTIHFVDRHPETQFVVDHIAKPRIRAGELEPWSTNLQRLAERPNVACKLSGVVTEANWRDWTLESLRPYLDAVLNAFQPHRLMFGSDWPVCLLACEYAEWVDLVRCWANELSTNEQRLLFHETATATYHLTGLST